MNQLIFFPFESYWWFYALFTGFVFLMLGLDLGVFHRKEHEVSIRESLGWTIIWISLAMLFNIGFYYFSLGEFSANEKFLSIPGFNPEFFAKQVSIEFLAGFVTEKALAVDNIFVFVVVFNFFAIPLKYQHRVLFFGILGALIFRAILIALGSVLMQYHAVILIAGVFLIFTGLKIIFSPEKIPDPAANPLIKLVRKFIPVTNEIHGKKFFVRINGKTFCTPLFLALIFLEFSDVIFALDSVPAIFAFTKEPLIVYTSNVFAILGLRSLYFLLAGAVDQFRYLKFGLGFILIFVGLKMLWLNELYDGKFPILLSLGIIGFILALSIAASLFIKPSFRLKRKKQS